MLKLRPKRLHIELRAPTKECPVVDGRPIFVLTPQMRSWSLDKSGQAKVDRIGFPIVPDFGGTAHAYCGDTLPACIGDLLEWFRKPRRDDALKAYIIMSRIRDIGKLLLAQPYSPQLFRQGVLPGPHLLLQVLSGAMTTEDAKKAWKEEEKAAGDKPIVEGSWLENMQLPCRECTDRNNGVEVTKPIKSFTIASTEADIWSSTVSKGQDLCCFRCLHTLQWKISDKVIPCDGCGALKARNRFTIEGLRLWESLSTDVLLCKQCGEKGKKGRHARDDSAEMIFCNGACQRYLPELHFIDTKLTDWKASDMLIQAKCARRVVRDMKPDDSYQYTCRTCKSVKHITCFSAIHMKQWFDSQRTHTEAWACYECQYPACCMCLTDNRPLFPISHNALVDGKYYCMEQGLSDLGLRP